MIKHTQIIRRLLPTYYLSVFAHFVVLAFKGLRFPSKIRKITFINFFSNK